MKQGKNHVSWNDNPRTPSAKEGSDSECDAIASPPHINKTLKVTDSAEFEELRQKLQRLKEEERTVDQYLEYLKEQAAVYNGEQLPTREHLDALPPGVKSVHENMFVRFKDITSMPQYKLETVIGVRTPSGTCLEVPDPDQGMMPGQRRFEMYLNNEGMNKAGEEKSEPIDVYLVQPTAEQQNKKEQGASKKDTSSREAPTKDRTQSPAPLSKGQGKTSSDDSPAAATPSTAPSRPASQDFVSPRYTDAYAMPPPHRSGEWGYGHGHQRGSAPPPPGFHPPERHWGQPPPYATQQTPSGFYPPRASARYQIHEGDRNHPGDRNSYSSENYSHDAESGHRQHGLSTTFQSRPPHFGSDEHTHERRSSGVNRETPGAFRPPSPTAQQQNLLNMPLQSPSEANYFQSPSGNGFSPPDERRKDVRSGGLQFQMPHLSRDAGDHSMESWHPSKRARGPSSRSNN